MLLATILELSAIPAAFGVVGLASYFLFGREPKVEQRPLREYQPEDRPMLAATQRYEFTDEHGNGLGELVPQGQDPHSAAQDRGIREGKSFGARAVKETP